MNIYVGNLSHDVTEDEIKEAFKSFGEVSSVKIIKDMFSGFSKGFGFVEMPNNPEADQAIKSLNGKFIEGKNIKVNPANPGGKRAKKSFQRRRF